MIQLCEYPHADSLAFTLLNQSALRIAYTEMLGG